MFHYFSGVFSSLWIQFSTKRVIILCIISYTLLSTILVYGQDGNCGTSNGDSCGPGATCILLDSTTHACLCPRGFVQTSSTINACQAINICDSPVCLNGATCAPDGSGHLSYVCNCLPGFTGTNCEKVNNVCDTPGNCLNGGTCYISTTNSNGYSCICPPNFTGEKCDAQRYIGVGGSGVPLSAATLVLLWGVWIACALTFAYCGINFVIEWWTNRMRKAVTSTVSS